MDLVLNPMMEVDQSTTKINATYVCLTNLYQPGLSVTQFLRLMKFLEEIDLG